MSKRNHHETTTQISFIFHVVWQQTPIDVVLPVGKERMVNFPSVVSFGYDKTHEVKS